jgi:transposase-like protein
MGTTPTTVLTEEGTIPLAVPRDCTSTFEPSTGAKERAPVATL